MRFEPLCSTRATSLCCNRKVFSGKDLVPVEPIAYSLSVDVRELQAQERYMEPNNLSRQFFRQILRMLLAGRPLRPAVQSIAYALKQRNCGKCFHSEHIISLFDLLYDVRYLAPSFPNSLLSETRKESPVCLYSVIFSVAEIVPGLSQVKSTSFLFSCGWR